MRNVTNWLHDSAARNEGARRVTTAGVTSASRPPEMQVDQLLCRPLLATGGMAPIVVARARL